MIEGNVLVVEGTVAIARLVSSLLSQIGVKEVTFTPSPLDGLARVRSGKHSFVVADYASKPITGLDLMRLANDGDVDVPFVLLVDKGHPVASGRPEDGGPVFLAKPFSAQQLAEAVAAAAGIDEAPAFI